MIQCPPEGKVALVGQIIRIIPLNQCIIFVESIEFAEKLLHLVRNHNFPVVLMFGEIDSKERNEIMTRFRKQYDKILITTNVLLRDIDVPEVDFVINFDVPILLDSNLSVSSGDPESYLNRIGKVERESWPGIALTLLDGD